MDVTHRTYAAYVQALADADVGAAVTALDDSLGRGATSGQLIREVVSRGQRETGERWLAGTWSVADEHAATAVAEQAMAVVAPPQRSLHAARRVLLACAEGEWHTFAARLAADLARSPTLDVALLGGSVPAAHLQHRLRGTRPDALALSVTLPSHLTAASRSISAAHAEGIPVVVGGAAWGDGAHGPHRAERLGADAHLADPSELARAVEELTHRGVRQDTRPVPVEAIRLDTPSDEVLRVAAERQAAAHAWSPSAGALALGAQPDLGQLARSTAASLACDDVTILRDLLSWLTELVTRRGLPAVIVHDGCRYLADAVEPEAPQGARLLREEADRAQGAPAGVARAT